MFARLARKGLFVVLLIAAVGLSGCATVPDSGTPGSGSTPGLSPVKTPTGEATVEPSPTVPSQPAPAAAIAAQEQLAEQLGLTPEEVSIVAVEPVEWPDACLGVEQPGMQCAQVIVPGYRVILEAQGQQYEFHTDQTGGAVVQAEGTRPAPTEAAAVAAARHALAVQLGAELTQVNVVSFEPTEWLDSCLGLGGPAESCQQVMTPGYLIILEMGGTQYEVRTNATGEVVRVAPDAVTGGTPQPQTGESPTGEALVLWQAETDPGCREARIFTDTVQYGQCGDALQTGLLLENTDRPAQLADLAKTYATFAADTAAGKVDFAGRGRIAATPAEQRMIAEWSSEVSQEAEAEGVPASSGLVLQWHREGGVAGFCDDLSIYATGYAFASDCSGNVLDMLGSRRLTADELDRLYTWIDDLQSFENEQTDPATADAMKIRMLFTGRGETEATRQDIAAINEYASQVLARWAEPTPVPTVQAQADVTIHAGPAETYPAVGEVFAGQDALVTGVNRDSTWWRVICPDDKLANCWVTADSELTRPNVPPGATGLAPLDETSIYATVARQVYTVDHTFGAAPNFPQIYLLRADDVSPGGSQGGAGSAVVAPPIQQGIVAALSDLPADFEWVSSIDEVPRDQNGSVADNGAVITLGNIVPQPDGKLHVAASIYIGMLAAGGQTYVLEQVDGVWKITGKTGPQWIS